MDRPPKAPGWLPAQIARLGSDPLAAMPRWFDARGDLLRVDVPRLPTLLVRHPDAIEKVLVSDASSYRKDFYSRSLSDVLGDGLLTSEGEPWKRRRRVVQPAFGPDALRTYGEVMAELAGRLVDGWGERQHVDVHAATMRLTLQVVARTLFGVDIGRDADAISAGIEAYQDAYRGVCRSGIRLPDRIPVPSNRRRMAAARQVREVVGRIVADNRHRGGDTLLAAMVRATEGEALTDEELVDESVTLLMAGHETTAAMLAFALYRLSQHPEVEEKLRDELDEVLLERAPTLADLPRLPYLHRVLDEVARLHPPAWAVGREALVDTELGGFRVLRGDQVWIATHATQRDARWFPEPERFDPDRWADDLEKRLPRGAYLPFGLGQRMCIGKRFARMEAAIVLAVVVRRASLRLAPGEALREVPAVTLRPEGGLRMVATARPHRVALAA